MLAATWHTIGNYIEAALWGVLGGGFAVAALLNAGRQRRRAAAAWLTLWVFGASDLIEVQTRHWARPWWLLVLKAACVAVLAAFVWVHWRDAGRKAT